MILRNYQLADVERLEAALAEHNRVVYVLPTGGGKTQVAAEMARRECERGGRVAIHGMPDDPREYSLESKAATAGALHRMVRGSKVYKRCPACEAMIPQGAGECPHCGRYGLPIEVAGELVEVVNVSAAARAAGLSASMVRSRMRKGMTLEQAIADILKGKKQ